MPGTPTFVSNAWLSEYLEDPDGVGADCRFVLGDLDAASRYIAPDTSRARPFWMSTGN